MEPNASLLLLLTISNNSEENIVFAFLKQLIDIAPEQLHWYRNKGEKGKAEFLWEDKKLKQWCLIGKDEVIEALWLKLITENELSYSWSKTTTKFTIPPLRQIEVQSDLMSIDGTTSCDEDLAFKEYICTHNPNDISFLIGEENNCKFIEGYKFNPNIKPIMPNGLFPEDFLKNKLHEGICAVFMKRGMHFEMRGDRIDATTGDADRLIGFVQAGIEFKKDHEICIRSIEGNKILGIGSIDLKTGKWVVELNEPASRGQFLIRNQKTTNYYCGKKYYLIKDIKLSTSIVHTVLVDLYGREINIANGEEPNKKMENSMFWNSSSAPDDRESQMVLSDRLTRILLSLGKRLIFNDPYFLGDIKEKDGQLVMSKSQFIFYNALITTIAKAKIEELIFIGSWRKAKNFVENHESLIKMHRLFYQSIKQTFNRHQLLKLNRFEIAFSKQPFHDRYWMSNLSESNIVYHVSNSINGAFETGELRIMPLSELDVLRIKPKIMERYYAAEKYNLIS